MQFIYSGGVCATGDADTLDSRTHYAVRMNRVVCPICAAATDSLGPQRFLGKYTSEYRRCSACGFIHVPNPHWLPEAYSSAITALDTGIVMRNLWLADASCALLGTSLRRVERILDYGGGSGLYTRLMRDRGYDAYWWDGYCDNLLAIGFGADLTAQYDLVTAFEFVEHLPDPFSEMQHMRARAPRMLLSTELIPEDLTDLRQWPYLAPEAGQHISFFSLRSLQITAERLQLKLSSNGRNLHLLAPETVPTWWMHKLRKSKHAKRWAWLGRRTSRTYTDADAMLARLRTAETTPPPQ